MGTLSLRDIKWNVVTPDTVDDVFSNLQRPIVIGLSESEYQELLLNFNDLQSYIEKQKAVIESYERYYIREDIEKE